MVRFSNLRTPPKLRTPSKLLLSFTKRSTPRPTPRAPRGGHVRSLIDKFNSINQNVCKPTRDILIDNVNYEEREDSIVASAMMTPTRDASLLNVEDLTNVLQSDGSELNKKNFQATDSDDLNSKPSSNSVTNEEAEEVGAVTNNNGLRNNEFPNEYVIEDNENNQPQITNERDTESPCQTNCDNLDSNKSDVFVVISKGSECETVEITQAKSVVPPKRMYPQRKNRKTKTSSFHEVARNAICAAAIEEQKKWNPPSLCESTSKDEDCCTPDVPVVHGIVEVTTVTSNDDDSDVHEEIFLERIGSRTMNDSDAHPTSTDFAEKCTTIISTSSSSLGKRTEHLSQPCAPAASSQHCKPAIQQLDTAQLLLPYLTNYYGNSQPPAPVPYQQNCTTYHPQFGYTIIYPSPMLPLPPQPMQQHYACFYPPPPPPPPPIDCDNGITYIRI